VAEERVSDPHVGCDGSAQVASPQHGPEDRGARDEVDDETRKLEYPEPEDDARRVAELSGRFQRRGQLQHLDGGVHEQEQNGEAAHDPPGPECFPGGHGYLRRMDSRFRPPWPAYVGG